jgi:CheY-like chemotaxis protein
LSASHLLLTVTAQGAGIGLFTANQNIKRYANGYLKLCSSVVNVGTTWSINLIKSVPPSPKLKPTPQTSGAEPAFKRAKIQGKADIRALFPGGIVLVDDDLVARTATKGALAVRYGVTVVAYKSASEFLDSMFSPTEAADGADAAGVSNQHRCLILLDHLMPEMDGEQALGHLPVEHPHTIVMMSGTHFTEGDCERIRSKGVATFFEKPLNWQVFDVAVSELG